MKMWWSNYLPIIYSRFPCKWICCVVHIKFCSPQVLSNMWLIHWARTKRKILFLKCMVFYCMLGRFIQVMLIMWNNACRNHVISSVFKCLKIIRLIFLDIISYFSVDKIHSILWVFHFLVRRITRALCSDPTKTELIKTELTKSKDSSIRWCGLLTCTQV